MSSDGHHIGRNAIWSVLNQSVSQILVLVVFLVNARFISKEDFGAMAIAMLVVEFIRQMTIESIGLTLMARSDPDRQDYNAGFIMVIFFSVVSSIGVFLSAKYFAYFMGNEKIEYTLEWICLILLTFGASRIHETWLSKNMQFRKLALRSIFSVLMGGGVGIYLAVQNYGIISLICQQIITTFLSSIFLWTTTDWKPGFDTTKEKLFQLFDYSKYLSLNNISYLVSSQADVFLSGYFLGAAQTGVYNAAKRIILAATLVIGSSIGSVSLPAISSANRNGDLQELQKSFLGFVRFSSFVTTPLFTGLSCLSPAVVWLLLGSKWQEASPILAILAPSVFLTTLSQYNSHIIMVKDRPGIQSMLAIGHTVMIVILLFLFARYGVKYAALAYTLKNLFIFPIGLWFALKYQNISILDYFMQIIFPIVSSLVMACIILVPIYYLEIPFSPALELIIFVPLGAFVYTLSMWILDRKIVLESFSFIKQAIGRQK